MKYALNAAALATVLLLGACAGSGGKPDAVAAAPATAASDGLSDEDRITLFVHYARSGDLEAVKKSLADGRVSVNAFDSLDQSALIAALSNNSLDEVKYLLAHGADPNLPDHAGWAPLHFAAWFGSSSVVLKELIDHGANVNARNDRGITPLYFASVSGHEAQVKALLALGADRSLASKAGYTPLRAAQVKGYYAVVALLDPDAAKAAPPAAAAPASAPAGTGTH